MLRDNLNSPAIFQQIQNAIPMAQEAIPINATNIGNNQVDNLLGFISGEFDANLARNSILEFSNNMDVNDDNLMKLFMLTILWGRGNDRRWISIFQRNEFNYIIGHLNRSIQQLNPAEYNLQNAFNELHGIRKFGVSFISKFLYFYCKPRFKNRTYPLIYDKRVAVSLLKLSLDKKDQDNNVLWTIDRSATFEGYNRYLELIHKLAKENKIKPDNYEYFLFNYRNGRNN